MSELTWDQPGPGSWGHDGTHNDGPKARFLQELFPQAMEAGFRSFTGRYGLPISHIEVRFVNDYAFDTTRIAGVPAGNRPPPPARVLRILTRLHPEFRRRERNARRALAERPWCADLDRWERVQRPARIAANRSLQAVDPTVADDGALASHLQACVANMADGMREHFSLIGASSIPVGLHIRRSASPPAAFEQLRGAAAGSTGATVPALRAIAAALAAVDVVPDSLDAVRNASPAAAAALDAYLDEYGQRLITTYDVLGKRLIEMPHVVLRSIVTAGAAPVTSAARAGGDTLLGDARRAFASRDDHAGVSGLWSMGLVRRVLLVAGARLAESGRLADPGHVFDCTPDQVVALLQGTGGPHAHLIAGRAQARAHAASVTPPGHLGPKHAMPDPASFPPAMRTVTEAMFAAVRAINDVDANETGEGIGDRVHRGRAVVAVGADDAIERLEPGDVLVTSMTTPAFNCILPIVGGLVTVHGGQFSHAGIVARELGIPAVVGVADALTRIIDGSMVEVDPVRSTVTVVAAPTRGSRERVTGIEPA